jgi:hypothetical protein
MAGSRLAGPTQHDPSLMCTPARTPGPLGVNDAADPDAFALKGDSPGSLGINDHAALAACSEPAGAIDYSCEDANSTPAYPYGIPGGRIPVKDRFDPGPGALVSVNRFGQDAAPQERVFQLTADALAAFRGLRSAAMAAGFDKELFTLTSAHRSADRQAQLAKAARQKYGKAAAGRWVAQNKSEHITGRAFDLNLGIANSSENARSKAFDDQLPYRWLKQNAQFFGLSPYSAEPWHWSYNPTGH